jgi:ubiquinone biosynthesis protein
LNIFHFTTNAVRITEISTILVRNGFLEFLEQIEAPSSWFSRFAKPRHDRLNIWQRIRVTAEDLGPTFVKFAQVLSARPDVLPQPLIDELKKLRDQVRPASWEDMRPALERELGGAVEETFAEFNPVPVACGSIGQVYRARLKSGEPVAVKIQRPGIRKEIRADFEIIAWFAQQMQTRVPELRAYDLPAIVAEAADGITQELDFTIEARNADFFNSVNPHPEEIFAPKVHESFTTKRLLVFEWVDGVAPAKVTAPPEERTRLANIGGRSTFHQIFITGFFHADPHSGNIFVTPDGRLCLIDWGLAGQLTRHMRYFLADVFSGVSNQDAEKVVQAALANAISKRRIDPVRLEKDVQIVLRKYQRDLSASENIGKVMLDLLYVFGSNGIRLARDYSLLTKAVIAIEETGKTFDPAFDINSIAQPFLRKLGLDRWSPKTLLGLAYWDLRAALRQLRELPGGLQRLLRNLEEGETTINFVHRGLDGLRTTLEHGVNRLVLAIIIAAILLSSSLIIARVGPETSGPLYKISEYGFIFALLFGLLLLYETWRHGRKK